MELNYTKICSEILKTLPEKPRTVLSCRFGLKNGEKKTLESIGKEYGITRERVRQIENDAFAKAKIKAKEYQKAFQCFKQCIKKSGGVKKEASLLEELGGKMEGKQAYFLLNLTEGLERCKENKDFYSFWALNQDCAKEAETIMSSAFKKLQSSGKLLTVDSLFSSCGKKLESCLEISKKIQKNDEGYFGLTEWPEINPRGIKDKAYLAFKKAKEPLHFTKVATLIKSALSQTVHNELIKDQRFVLVGRGLYALREWGYEDGDVKDVIFKILKNSQKPLTKKEITEKVLKQRFVKENTVSLNLNNKNNFLRTSEDCYTIREEA